MSKTLPYEKIISWIKKNNVVDVALFGSSVRGKDDPRDIDLCILLSDTDEEKSIDLAQSLRELLDGHPIHVSAITSSSFVQGDPLAKTVLHEGYSILQKKPFATSFDLKSRSLFNYSLKTFSPSDRVRFHYALKGRNKSSGMLESVNGKLLSPGSIIVPIDMEDKFKSFMDYWKMDYKIQRIMIS